MCYALLIALWIVWCSIHSFLISNRVTESLRKRFAENFRFYRLAFNLFSALTLVPIVFYEISIRSEPIVAWYGIWHIVPVLLSTAGIVLLLAGALRYDLLQFLGLRQVASEDACSVLTDDCSLETDGILAVVRHPWYTAGILLIWVRPLDLAAIITNLVITAYFVLGAMLEERKLLMLFGRQYADYQQRVSMLLPVKWARSVLFPKR